MMPAGEYCKVMHHEHALDPTPSNGSRAQQREYEKQTRVMDGLRELWPAVILLVLAGLVRGWRLEWQPLWWDEGYSVYFATESVGEMVRLTARDIHPPLYYGLLRGWLLLVGNASPLTLRLFSLLLGILAAPAIWWLARRLFSGSQLMPWLAGLLLALSPMHLFYSQEVRMYGLEMLLGILSTGFVWQLCMQSRSSEGIKAHRWPMAGTGYVLSTAALLYTEYYSVLLPLGHLLWALWTFRRVPGRLRTLLFADLLVGLAYLPWLVFAVPELIPYIGQKLVADADRPLSLPTYIWRHLLAFSSGHVEARESLVQWGQRVAAVLTGIALVSGHWPATRNRSVLTTDHGPLATGVSLAAFCLLVPTGIAFAINRWMPFFPPGGERVLLFVLPYFLLLIALVLMNLLMGSLLAHRMSGAVGLVGLLLAAGTGVWAFYTVPRYTTEDYRPLIRQTVQQGSDADTVFVVFPWQLGYWRTYAPVWGRADIHGPLPVLSPSPEWNTDVAAVLDSALTRGKLWFPAHLSMGGILEGQIEAHLRSRADIVNFEKRWYSHSTHLSGWSASRAQLLIASCSLPISCETLQKTAHGLQISAANEILPLHLTWRLEDASVLPLQVSLRLLDESERLWAIRDFEWTDGWGEVAAAERRGMAGLLVPAGIPPGWYTVVIGVVAASHHGTAVLGTVQVQPPTQPLPPLRLPIRFPLAQPLNRAGIRFLGSSGYDLARPTTAGTELAIDLFVQAENNNLPQSQLYVSLLDGNGAGAAGWEGWPLPTYPTSRWQKGGLVRLPVRFFLPADLPAGPYQPIAGLIDTETGRKSASVAFADLAVVQRPHNFNVPQPAQAISPRIQLGMHVQLLGYDISREEDRLDVTFYWEALQPLLPPHKVFVHLVDSSGALLSQDDSLPGGTAAPVPSGTWLPGEFLTDPHRLILPDEAAAPLEIRIGLYDPSSGKRLPVTAGASDLPTTIIIPVPAISGRGH